MPGVVVPCEGEGFFVRSASTPGAFYLVEPDGSCSCPATVGSCRHLRAVLAFVDGLREAAAEFPHLRPTAFVAGRPVSRKASA